MKMALHFNLSDPLGAREQREESKGVTMIIDKGLGLHSFIDLLETAAKYTDFVKLGFGTTALYPNDVLLGKLELAKKFGVEIYPGGTFFEVAFHQGESGKYFEAMKELGFEKVEISDGTIELNPKQRIESIKLATSLGLTVITEFGKKAAGSATNLDGLIKTIESDLSTGANFVIVEGRESGENVGIYDSNGKMQDNFPEIAQNVTPYIQNVIWEAPKKEQQVELIHWFGPNVNLGNIPPEDIFSVESLRRGLRSDTFFLSTRGKQL